jgi:putative acetyltransferase
MSHEWTIRTENNLDYDSIDRVIAAASGEPETVELVRRLRTDGDALLSLVAEAGTRIVGHIMMSRISIGAAGSHIAAVALAPLMVDPKYQNKGIGSSLTRVALERCRDAGENIVFVLGHPTYYPRFGFSADLAQHLQIPFNLKVPGAFMALELEPGALKGISGRVKYAEAFQLPPEWTMERRTGCC